MCEAVRQGVSNLDDRMEKAHSEDNLPPLASQSVVFKEIPGDLCEGPSHVGSQAFGRLIGYLETGKQKYMGLGDDMAKTMASCAQTDKNPGFSSMLSVSLAKGSSVLYCHSHPYTYT